MKADLISHISECIPCQKTTPIPKNNVLSTGSLNSVKRFFECLYCNTIGPLSVDSYANKYVIHFVDAFSKFSFLVPVADITALTVVNSIFSHVFSVFGAPRSIHSDNGPKFSNKIFSLLCQFLNNEHILTGQIIYQSEISWNLSGTNTSPRLLSYEMLEALKSPVNQPDLSDYLVHLSSLTQALTDFWNRIELDSYALEPSALLTMKNPITKNLLKTSFHLVKPCTFFLPTEILDSYVAADKGEHVIDAIDSIENNEATIIWSDGTSTVQPVDSIKNTAAYKRFMLLHEDVPRKKTRGKKKRGSVGIWP
ncbi:hypothetical protein P9112_001555 [Eukaryota sp. TZLM1-RC]